MRRFFLHVKKLGLLVKQMNGTGLQNSMIKVLSNFYNYIHKDKKSLRF